MAEDVHAAAEPLSLTAQEETNHEITMADGDCRRGTDAGDGMRHAGGTGGGPDSPAGQAARADEAGDGVSDQGVRPDGVGELAGGPVLDGRAGGVPGDERPGVLRSRQRMG